MRSIAFVLRLFVVLAAVGTVAVAQEQTPWRTQLRTLPAQQAPKEPLATEALLRPELAFKPARRWVFFAELAKEFASEDVKPAVVQQVLEEGGKALRQALAAEKADKDLGTATALLTVQLWQWSTGKELSETQADAVHAQTVLALATPDVAAMRDADKQRCWELCVGYTTWFAALFEAAPDAAQQAPLRQAAAQVFEKFVGVAPGDLRPTARGLVARKPVAKPVAKPETSPDAVTRPAPRPDGAAPPVTPPPAAAPAKPGVVAGATPLPSSGPPLAGVTWTAPAGWAATTTGDAVVYRATLGDVEDGGQPIARSESTHQAVIGFLPVQTATAGPSALFERVWREQFGAFALGDMFVHYRGRLPSQLVVLYMGRFHRRPDAPTSMGNPDTYGALWLVDLGGNRFQPIVAAVEPRDPGIGMDQFKESAALRALGFPLGKVLDSVQPKGGKPPYPAGGYFAAVDLFGEWEEASSAFGGSCYNTVTGGFAGVAVTASSGSFVLRPDGTYDYAFSYYAVNPQFGNNSGASKHAGSFRLDGDVVLVQPSAPLPYEFSCCAVGIGRVVTPKGDRRVLFTVSKNGNGAFVQMPLIPNGAAYSGALTSYVEKAK
jgi:hypothetical protein